MSRTRRVGIPLLLVAMLMAAVAQECEQLTAGLSVEGHLNPVTSSQCFTITKPSFTREFLMIDTAAYDVREGYYICTNVSHGASGHGCSSPLREQQQSLCLSGVDGAYSELG